MSAVPDWPVIGPREVRVNISDLPADHSASEAHRRVVGGQPSPQPVAAIDASLTNAAPWQLAGALLAIHSDDLDQLEGTRIATENRVRDLRMYKGGEDSPEEARLKGLIDALLALEHGCELELKRCLRRHPLGDWVKRTVGVGEKQGARLIAALGDPYWNAAADRPRRGPAELWAYCGLHVLHPGQLSTDGHCPHARVQSCDTADQLSRDGQSSVVGGVAPRKTKGQRANWNAAAKVRAFLVAESCVKHRASPYRTVYDAGREKYADAVHNTPCVRCVVKGSKTPAPTGSPLGSGHQHARALRLVMKAVLRDLWVESKRLHS